MRELPDRIAYEALFESYLRRADHWSWACNVWLFGWAALAGWYPWLLIVSALGATAFHWRALRMLDHAGELADQRLEQIRECLRE